MEAVSLSTLKKIIEKVDKRNEQDFSSFVELLYDRCHIIVDSDVDDILDYLEYLGVNCDFEICNLTHNNVNDLWEFINNLFYE